MSSFTPDKICNDIVLFILFPVSYKCLTQTVDSFSGSWSSWASIGLNNSFANSLIKAPTKAVWVCLLFFVALRISMFFEQLCHLTFKFRAIITLKYLWVFKHTILLIDWFQHKCNLAWFFGPGKFISWCNINKIYLYVFPSKTLWGI